MGGEMLTADRDARPPSCVRQDTGCLPGRGSSRIRRRKTDTKDLTPSVRCEHPTDPSGEDVGSG